MIRHLVIDIVILVGFVWCSDQLYSDYKDCKATTSDAACYTNNSVFNSWKRSDINIFSNTENVCRFQTEYNQLIYCKYNQQLPCLPDDRSKALFMTAGAEEKGFLHICSKPEAMNITCLRQTEQEVGECQTEAKLGPLSKNATFEEWKENRCRLITVTYECTRNVSVLEECQEVKSIYLEYSRITYPKACGDLSATSATSPTSATSETSATSATSTSPTSATSETSATSATSTTPTHNGQQSIFTHLLSFSQLTLISIITFSYL